MAKSLISMDFDKKQVNQLQRALNSYGINALSKVASPAIGAALRPINKALKDEAKSIEDNGTYLRAVASRRKTYRHSGVVIGMVGLKSAFREEHDGKVSWPAKIAHILEFGSKRQAALSPMDTAFKSSKSSAKAKLAETLKRLHKKQAKKEFAKTMRSALK